MRMIRRFGEETNRKRNELLDLLAKCRSEIHRVIIGQDDMITQIFIGLFVRGRQPGDPFGGHILLEGSHGTAKTKLIETIGRLVDLRFQRLQCTPDLMPFDITGGECPKPGDLSCLEFKPGPVFTDLLLADELNRTSPKCQSALLEPMEERKVDLGGKTYPLSEFFRVLATINPHEEQGSATYSLPVAQIDRFLINHHVTELTEEEERLVTAGKTSAKADLAKGLVTKENLVELSGFVAAHFHDKDPNSRINIMITDLVRRTRIDDTIHAGASPRAASDVRRVAECIAFLAGEDRVLPRHVTEAALPVLRARLILSDLFSATDPDRVITDIMGRVPIPGV